MKEAAEIGVEQEPVVNGAGRNGAADLIEMPDASAVGDIAAIEKKNAEPMPDLLNGKVSAVKPELGCVVINLGTKHGVKVGMPFQVRRGNKVIATVRVVDARGIVAPRADHRLAFKIDGPGEIVATDNGDPTSFEPFQSPERKAFNGLCLAIIRAKSNA